MNPDEELLKAQLNKEADYMTDIVKVNEKLQDQVRQLNAQKSRNLWAYYKNLRKVGFNRWQAFKLITLY